MADSEPLGLRVWNRRLSRRDVLWLAAVTTASTALAGTLAGCAVDPVTGEQRLMLLSERDEIAIDRQHAPHQFANDYGRSPDAGLNRYLATVGAGIARHSHRSHMPYSFQAVNANHLNAYAFPGGTIACTRGILCEMEDESQLAALLGHETGHVAARHAAERQTQQMLSTLAVGGLAIAAGRSSRLEGYSDAIYAIGALSVGALLAYYSRANERQADALGMDYAVAAGHAADGMGDLMALLVEEQTRNRNALELMFATHPMSSERYQTARQVAATRYGPTRQWPRNRDRYQDATANLQRHAGAIRQLRDGEADMAAKRYRSAEASYRNALATMPDDYCALVLMAECQSAQGRQQEAAAYLRRARQVDPAGGKAIHLSGITQLSLGRPDAALAEFQRYEQVLPGNPNTVFLEGVALESMQARAAAAERYRRYLGYTTQTPQAQYAITRLQAWR